MRRLWRMQNAVRRSIQLVKLKAHTVHPRFFRDQLMDKGSKSRRVIGGSMSEHEAYRLEDGATALIKSANGPGETLRSRGILDNGTQVRLSSYETTFSDLVATNQLGGAARRLAAELAEAA
jgi:hypothetical protein